LLSKGSTLAATTDDAPNGRLRRHARRSFARASSDPARGHEPLLRPEPPQPERDGAPGPRTRARGRRLRVAVVGDPAAAILEQPHAANVATFGQQEPMVELGRDDEQVAAFDPEAHPVVIDRADVEDTLALEDVADFVVRVSVLVRELAAELVELGRVRAQCDDVLLDVTTRLLQPIDEVLWVGFVRIE